jgi:hypothetical protein
VDTVAGATENVDEFYAHDLNAGLPPLCLENYDFILLLDVIEHLARPELFFERLKKSLAFNPSAEIIISTGNVAFIVMRMMLLIGQFNYGKRGILDLTHSRLFTFASLTRAVTQAGFVVLERRGVPAPFPLAIGRNVLSRLLLAVNRCLLWISPGLFSYQILMRLKAQPSLEFLLNAAREESRDRASGIEGAAVHAGNGGELS